MEGGAFFYREIYDEKELLGKGRGGMTVISKMMSRKVAAVLIALCSLTSVAFAGAPYQYTAQQEYQFGDVIWAKSALAHYQDEGINNIVDHIVKDNPDVLRMRSGENDTQRGLQYPYIIPDNESNAHNLPGGIITINQGLVQECLYNKVSSQVHGTGDKTVIYGRSQVANIIAHEMTHWINRDWFRMLEVVEDGEYNGEVVHRSFQDYINRSDWKLLMDNFTAFSRSPEIKALLQQNSKRVEMEADAGAFRLLEHSDIYSPGSLAVYMETRMTSPPPEPGHHNKLNQHPEPLARYNAILDRISEASGGRVRYENHMLYLDGKKFLKTGTMPDTLDGNSTERTLFLAGQLAKAVKYRMGTRTGGGLYFTRGTMDSDGRVALMGKNNMTGQTVMFDLFNVSADNAIALMEGKKPVGVEEEALVAIHDFLKKGV